MIFLPVFKNIPWLPCSKGYWVALQWHQSTPAHLVLMGTLCHMPITCTCPVYLNVPWSDHALLSPCSRLSLWSSVHYRNLLDYLCPFALLNQQIPGWFSMKTRTTTGRRLHLILLPGQKGHSRHPQYHDIGWASNPTYKLSARSSPISRQSSLPILLSHTKGDTPSLLSCPVLSWIAALQDCERTHHVSVVMMRPQPCSCTMNL